MNRIEEKFKKLRAENKKALIAYITAGDPDIDKTYELAVAMIKNGADIVELGFPFSDPLADGPVIQRASERALKNGICFDDLFSTVRKLRTRYDTPLVTMTYYNPVLQYGLEQFVSSALESGLDGVIIPDLPLEESGSLYKISQDNGLNLIFLIAPTSPSLRIKAIANKTSGFIYMVSLTGVTGEREKLPDYVIENIKKVKEITNKPVAVGFGISTSQQAREISNYADGIIVGSAIIKIVEKYLNGFDEHLILKEVGRFIAELRISIDNRENSEKVGK